MPETTQCGSTATILEPILLALFLMLASGCSPSTADLSGDVFVTMRSGDVKRGAGVEVLLISPTPQFEADWREMLTKIEGCNNVALALGKDYRPSVAECLLSGWFTVDPGTLLRRHQAHAIRTDANGHYELKALRREKYLVYARLDVFENIVAWMVPIDLTAGSKKLDLSNHNQGLPAA
jgi:hypothetical protein